MFPENLGAELHPIDMPPAPNAPPPATASTSSGTSWLILGGALLLAGAIGWYVVKGK